MTSDLIQDNSLRVKNLLEYILTDTKEESLIDRIYKFSVRVRELSYEERDILISEVEKICSKDLELGLQLISKGRLKELSDKVEEGLDSQSNYTFITAVDTVRNLGLNSFYEKLLGLYNQCKDKHSKKNILIAMAKLKPHEVFPKVEHYLFTADKNNARSTAANILYDLNDKHDFSRIETLKRVLSKRVDGDGLFKNSCNDAREMKSNEISINYC